MYIYIYIYRERERGGGIGRELRKYKILLNSIDASNFNSLEKFLFMIRFAKLKSLAVNQKT